MKTIHIKVTGIVQGVFFRQNTLNQARALDITGWVRNVPDGSVEITATGDQQQLESFLAWCRKGPSRAKVEAAEWSERELEVFRGFEIRR